MTKLVLYSHEISPPCRAVLLTAEAIGINLDIHEINLMSKDHLADDFVKINPQHTIPTLRDNDLVMWDSHAIMCYLINKYAKDDSLYPKDPQKRAVVDQHLHFDCGVLFSLLKRTFKPIIFMGQTTVPKEKYEALEEAYGFLDKFLEGKKWLAGDAYTLADISCVSSVSSLTVLRPLDGYPNVQDWLKRCEEQLPGYEKVNVPGNNMLHAAIRSKLS